MRVLLHKKKYLRCDPHSGSWLVQQVSVTFQRGDAASIIETFVSSSPQGVEEIFRGYVSTVRKNLDFILRNLYMMTFQFPLKAYFECKLLNDLYVHFGNCTSIVNQTKY